ncbi:hypothetical protein [Sulfobacillus harzensis]|uniref:Spore germination protein N-terminal domain-containing protein n=1 Tax=Sulfobacillus harzensis TaxID=2729629 RepID=A0A7Y0L6E5_9FIRM|nr:hypothetical protein [Sulfobacillus harzensis]NMP24096.1 hypothetical protein [Sulfobacillus harzensis]
MKIWVRVTLLITLMVSLTGCWDQHPVEFRAAVAAIAVDPTAKAGEYAFTFLFPNITVTATSIAETASNQQFYAIHVRAPTLVRAITSVQRRHSRSLYLGQIRVLYLSTQLPVSMWQQTLKESADSGRFVLTFWVVGAPKAGDALLVTPPTEVVPDVVLYRALNSRIQPDHWPGRAWRLWRDMVTPGVSPAVIDVHPHGDQIAIHQLAVIGNHVVLWSPMASTGWAYLTGRVIREAATVKVGGHSLTVGLIHGRTRLRVVKSSGQFVVKARLVYTGELVGNVSGAGDSIEEERQVEAAVVHHIQGQVLDAWHTALKTHTDPMGFHRLGNWENATIPADAHDWAHWALDLKVRFTLRDEGVLR